MDVCIVGLVCTGGGQTRRTVTHGLLQGAVRGGESGEKFYPAVRENTFFFFLKWLQQNLMDVSLVQFFPGSVLVLRGSFSVSRLVIKSFYRFETLRFETFHLLQSVKIKSFICVYIYIHMF